MGSGMSHVTQCPACSTHFRVVSDQLKISDGWVRCGQCGEVFDAKVSMSPWPPTPPAALAEDPVAEPPSLAVEEPQPDARSDPNLPTTDDGLLSSVAEATSPVGPLAEPVAESAAQQPDPEPELEREPPVADAGPAAPDAGVAEGAAAEESASAVPLTDVAFVRQARRRALWKRPWIRAVMGLGLGVLCGLLVLQAAVHHRDRWAAAYPGLAPWLSALVEPLGLTLEPYRHISSVLIDSSALVRERQDLYRLEVGLKNTADLVMAVPALELSLTDANDQVVLRRVLLPADWDAPLASLPPNATEVLTVRLSLAGADSLRMAGYRALVFYP